MATIQEQIEYLGTENFVKYINTEDFTELPVEIRMFLKQYGMLTHRMFLTDGKIKPFKKDLLEIGINSIDEKYCIDIKTNNIILYEKDENIVVYNSSVQKFIEAHYVETYYLKEIEYKEVYGGFYENKNHLKYAKVFREMLDAVEPTGIRNFLPWEEEIYQKELGVV